MAPTQGTRKITFAYFLGAAWIMLMGTTHAQTEKGVGVVSEGKDVSLEYTLTLKDQTILDTNVGQDPLVYTHGSHQIVPGLEKELTGMKPGEQKQVTVSPEEGYGPVNPEAFLEISKENLPPDTHKIGTVVEGKDNNGRPLRPRVTEVKENTVVLDFNHPLAGKTLYFDVTVIDIK